MGRINFYCAGTTKACSIASQILQGSGISFSEIPGSHTTDVLLDVPSFRPDGQLRSGEELDSLLSRLSNGVRIWGGRLPPMEGMIPVDLLQDSCYLAENAAITADCAIRMTGPMLHTTWKDTRVLIIGWGRIGKQLCRSLRAMGASVTVCTRKASDRALLRAFGYGTAEPEILRDILSQCDVLINTAPAQILGREHLDCLPRLIALDLASMEALTGTHVISARGLPGTMAPRASGQLIADTILRLGKEIF